MKLTLLTLALLVAIAQAAPLEARAKKTSPAKKPKAKSSAKSSKATTVPTISTGYTSSPSVNTGSSGSSSGLITEACNIGYATLNGGTTGGGSASTTTVTSLAELTACATKAGPAVCLIKGAITGNTAIKVTADTTIAGAAGSSLTGVGFRVFKVKNVILRNLKISKVLASAGDAIGIQKASNVWVDHCDLSSDQDHGKDYYDGLCDITHASDYITVSNTYLHDHYKASLVGHSDNNGAEDTGHLIVTYANNFFENLNSRGPSVRFGTAHIYNHYAKTASTGVNTRIGAQLLIESSVFEGVPMAIQSAYSKSVGYATVKDVDLGTGTNTVKASTLTSVPYKYTLLGSEKVASAVTATAGQTLKF
ncbi:uncharacterized protein L3040_008218 [Drepanopeziza brunnea f. sp. 'multigermtubi']|uniref:pectate lyase n=1 Tax=Marssonina brunnea f. sp. multigermtubi (strain MB_m1) TaxID=1072389 RepID=K1XIY1_MARBU|nr:pectate lyase a [Drepanopeziza brunnea f. sp. 'multigermtubi' MB_m1]EKD12454.1 pectate lyase a [Drepanopeziza brunnea f. sp. 'multigermtubi' MB_m1]KAJ5034951.1 hypothetical protein L3040_008218 [Drepanopeziza brunnea f. sp. 'multigermtubi']